MKTKFCISCKKEATKELFSCSKRRKDGLHKICKVCDSARLKEWRKQNPEFEKGNKLKKFWPSLTHIDALNEYNNLFIQQNGVCSICNKPEKSLDGRTKKQKALAVDHCHKTGKVRGLLCWACNSGLGKFNEDFELVLNLAKYILEHKGVI